MNISINQPSADEQVLLPSRRVDLEAARSISVDELCVALYKDLGCVMPDRSLKSISLLCAAKPVLDDVTKLIVKDQRDRPSAVILCSPPAYPHIVATYMERTQQASKVLGPTLDHVVVAPLHQGTVNGLSYTVLPYHQPLESSKLKWYWQRFRLGPEMFQLLQQITATTCQAAGEEQVKNNFVKPLNYLIQLEECPDSCRNLAKKALASLSDKSWQPHHVLMHNDLWKGNVLLSREQNRSGKNWQNRFVLIDWSGSTTQGYGIYDLIRLAGSMQLSATSLRHQLEAHCKVLNCTMEQAEYHLVTALGYLAVHLENFPMNRFLDLLQNCMNTFEAAQKS
ncbi:MAG: hypothetical protein AAGD25_12060 [Cyanobacteria bacterium P01_F01_bin.150]